MRVLITGASGFIGSHLADELHRRGYNLRCLVRQTSNLQWIKELPIEYVHGDLFDARILCDAVKGVDFVYHLAGLTKARTKEEYYHANHIATRSLLEAVRQENPNLKRFIHVSSQAAVGPSLNGLPVDEQTPFHPITTYGKSKMEAERECKNFMGEIPITIVRPPAVYGPRDKDIFEFFSAMNRGLHPMIGFTNKLVSLVHVKDLINGTILAGEHATSAGQTYFISSKQYYTWREVGEVTGRVMNKRVLRLRVPELGVYAIAGFSELFGMVTRKPVLLNVEKARDIVQASWTCSIDKARNELGYEESFTLEEGVRETVAWYRNQGWLR